ncbi:MAG: transcriptional repressor [Clostridia bacterium]
MARGGYQTRQKAALMRVLVESRACAHTAEEIFSALRESGEAVGHTTVYRQLNELNEAGFVRRTQTGAGAIYQYVENANACAHHLHCQCVVCGQFYHVDCGCIKALAEHLLAAHHFILDAGQSVLLGKCEECRKEAEHGAIDTQKCDAGL